MTADPAQPRSRRALLVGGLGAAVAAVAASLGRPSLVDAGSDGDVVLSAKNTEVTETSIFNINQDLGDTPGSDAFYGDSLIGNGVRGHSLLSDGVSGSSDQRAGVFGQGNTAGVSGWAQSATGVGVLGRNYVGNGTGIHGESKNGAGIGVLGSVLSSTGTGVKGMATTGSALEGTASAVTGYALKTSGRLAFGKVSGVATISAGKTATAIIYPGTDVTSSSYVLLTPQRDPGTRRFWAVLSATSNSVTIKTNDTRTYSIRIAWLLVG